MRVSTISDLSEDNLTTIFKIIRDPDVIWDCRRVCVSWRAAAKRAYEDSMSGEISRLKNFLIFDWPDRHHDVDKRERINGEPSWNNVNEYFEGLHDFYDLRIDDHNLGEIICQEDYQKYTLDLLQAPFGRNADWNCVGYLIRSLNASKYHNSASQVWKDYDFILTALMRWFEYWRYSIGLVTLHPDDYPRDEDEYDYQDPLAWSPFEQMNRDLLRALCHILLIDFEINNELKYEDKVNDAWQTQSHGKTYIDYADS